MGNPMKAGARVRGWGVGGCPPTESITLVSGLVVVVGHPPSCCPPQISVAMELSVSGLEDVGDAITFQLQLQR